MKKKVKEFVLDGKGRGSGGVTEKSKTESYGSHRRYKVLGGRSGRVQHIKEGGM